MDEEAFNISIRKFLTLVGVSCQREIEQSVREALASGKITEDELLPATMTLEIPALQLTAKFASEIKLK